MKNKVSLILIFFGLLPIISFGQLKIDLRLDFDEYSKTYKVLAKPNFSKKDFLWGPSQISLVFPEKIQDSSIDIASRNAGVWSDNSRIFAPKSQIDCDFHGFGTNGAHIDLVEGYEYELFEFSLNKTKIEGLRIFTNGLDPESSGEGMRGSDFRNSIVGLNGEELYANNYELMTEAELNAELSSEMEAYPNPSSGKFQLMLNGMKEDQKVNLSYYNSAGMLLFQELEEVRKINTIKRVLPSSIMNQTIYVRTLDISGKPIAKKIVIRN